MGSIIYSHLNESLLLDRSLIAESFASISDKTLEEELQKYREFCLFHYAELEQEVAPEAGRLRLYVGSMANSDFLKQAAFYLDTVILADPLFKITQPEHKFSSALSSAMKMPPTQVVDRGEITAASIALLTCRPLVARGYVRFFPTSLEDEPPPDLPIYAPTDGFEGVLPKHLLDLYKEAANVRSIALTDRGLMIENELRLGRRIHIDFDAKSTGKAYGYNLLEQEIISVNQSTGQFEVKIRMPEKSPSEDSFNNWVAQSINSSARNHFSSIERDIHWSTRFGASYLTRSPFAASVLESGPHVSSSISETTASGIINLELPFFDGVSMSNLMAAREDEEAFRRFRLLLEKNFRELRLELDPAKRKVKTENAMHELLEVQLCEVSSTISRLKRKAILNGIGTVATLAAAVPTSGFSLIGTLYAFYAGCKTYEEFQMASKENPAYFLWRTKSTPSKR